MILLITCWMLKRLIIFLYNCRCISRHPLLWILRLRESRALSFYCLRNYHQVMLCIIFVRFTDIFSPLFFEGLKCYRQDKKLCFFLMDCTLHVLLVLWWMFCILINCWKDLMLFTLNLIFSWIYWIWRLLMFFFIWILL